MAQRESGRSYHARSDRTKHSSCAAEEHVDHRPVCDLAVTDPTAALNELDGNRVVVNIGSVDFEQHILCTDARPVGSVALDNPHDQAALAIVRVREGEAGGPFNLDSAHATVVGLRGRDCRIGECARRRVTRACRVSIGELDAVLGCNLCVHDDLPDGRTTRRARCLLCSPLLVALEAEVVGAAAPNGRVSHGHLEDGTVERRGRFFGPG